MLPSAVRVARCATRGQKKSRHPNRGTGTESANEKGIVSAHQHGRDRSPAWSQYPTARGHTLRTTIAGRSSGLRVQDQRANTLVHPTVRLRLLGLPRVATGRHAFNANGLCAAGRSRSQRRVHGGFAPPSLSPGLGEEPTIVSSQIVTSLEDGSSARSTNNLHQVGCPVKSGKSSAPSQANRPLTYPV